MTRSALCRGSFHRPPAHLHFAPGLGLRVDVRTYSIIGAAMRVHSQLGPGFLERAYQDAFAIALTQANVHFVREHELALYFDGVRLPTRYRADFVCFDQIIVELKAKTGLADVDRMQVVHYLRSTRHPLGLIINFGARRLQFGRIVNGYDDSGERGSDGARPASTNNEPRDQPSTSAALPSQK